MIQPALKIRATGMSSIIPGPSTLSGGYQYMGWQTEPIGDEPSPRQIVAGLHAEIAAKSPELAALVADYEKYAGVIAAWDPVEDLAVIPDGPLDRREKMQVWVQLRDKGMSVKEAAASLGIDERTGRRWETELRAEARRWN